MIQTNRSSRAMRTVLAASILLAASIPQARAAQERFLAAGARRWQLTPEGKVTGVGVPADLPRLEDAALSPGAAILYGIVPEGGGKGTTVFGFSLPEGKIVTRWTVKGAGRFLAVSRDGDHACIVGLRPGARAEGADAWTLTVVALESGRIHGPVPLGVVPADVILLQTPMGDLTDFRLYVATRSRIATFGMRPPASSWYHSSPGMNHRVAGIDGSAVIVVLRDDATLAIFDPSRRPREQGRVVMKEDDAAAVVELPAPARAVAMVQKGRVAAVLRQDGLQLTLVDVQRGEVIESRTLPAPATTIDPDSIGTVALPEPAPPRREKPAGEGAPSARLPDPEPAPEDASAPEEEPEPGPPADDPEAPAAPDSGSPEPAPPSPEPAPQPPEPVPPAPEPPPRPPEPPPRSPEPAPAPPPAAVDRTSGLVGRVDGSGSAGLHVLLYGPGNILKLNRRAVVESDGTFHFPVPPPGAYRVVVTAAPGTNVQIFTAPDYRSILVGDDTRLLTGIDFRLRGRL